LGVVFNHAAFDLIASEDLLLPVFEQLVAFTAKSALREAARRIHLLVQVGL
jgi:hypothetical protein